MEYREFCARRGAQDSWWELSRHHVIEVSSFHDYVEFGSEKTILRRLCEVDMGGSVVPV